MNKMSTGLCFAAAVGLAATLGAQSPTSTTTASRPTTADKDHDVTITGCLSKTAGSYTLTNARMDTDASSSTTTAGGSTTTASSSTTGTTGTSGASGNAAGAAMAGRTWTLTGDSDLEKHVGHKIQVTGKASADSNTASSTSTASTSTTSATTTGSNAEPRLDVKSIKMVSSICS